jgi:hypothetical protein
MHPDAPGSDGCTVRHGLVAPVFFAQPNIAERVINADPDAWYRGDPEATGGRTTTSSPGESATSCRTPASALDSLI